MKKIKEITTSIKDEKRDNSIDTADILQIISISLDICDENGTSLVFLPKTQNPSFNHRKTLENSNWGMLYKILTSTSQNGQGHQKQSLRKWNMTTKGSAAAAAKWLQSCPTLCDPIDGSPPGSPIPGILQARTLEWLAISFSNAWNWKVKVRSLSRVRFFVTPWTAAYQTRLSKGFFQARVLKWVAIGSEIL